MNKNKILTHSRSNKTWNVKSNFVHFIFLLVWAFISGQINLCKSIQSALDIKILWILHFYDFGRSSSVQPYSYTLKKSIHVFVMLLACYKWFNESIAWDIRLTGLSCFGSEFTSDLIDRATSSLQNKPPSFSIVALVAS